MCNYMKVHSKDTIVLSGYFAIATIEPCTLLIVAPVNVFLDTLALFIFDLLLALKLQKVVLKNLRFETRRMKCPKCSLHFHLPRV